jgi:DHA1 family bicyclomycin/chloramphenicol resistance-like MFS transporter
MAQVTMLFGLAPAVAPVLGGYLHRLFRLAVGFRVPDTVRDDFARRLHASAPGDAAQGGAHTLSSGPTRAHLPAHLRQCPFRGARFIAGVRLRRLLVYVASSADFVLTVLGLSERGFAWLFVPIVIGLVGGSWLVNLTAGRVPADRTALYGYLLMAAGAAFNLLYNVLFTPQVPWAVLPIVLYALGVSLQGPILTLYALDLFPKSRGLASSLQGFLQTMLFAGVSSLVVPLVLGSGFRHALVMAVALALNYLGWRYFHWAAPAAARPAEVGSEVG